MNKELKFPIMGGKKLIPDSLNWTGWVQMALLLSEGKPDSRLLKPHASPLGKRGHEWHGAGSGPADEAADRAGYHVHSSGIYLT